LQQVVLIRMSEATKMTKEELKEQKQREKAEKKQQKKQTNAKGKTKKFKGPLFGVPLNEIMAKQEGGLIPDIVKECIDWLRKNGEMS
jgi:membrane peptidoglycan carboxypeptidase